MRVCAGVCTGVHVRNAGVGRVRSGCAERVCPALTSSNQRF